MGFSHDCTQIFWGQQAADAAFRSEPLFGTKRFFLSGKTNSWCKTWGARDCLEFPKWENKKNLWIAILQCQAAVQIIGEANYGGQWVFETVLPETPSFFTKITLAAHSLSQVPIVSRSLISVTISAFWLRLNLRGGSSFALTSPVSILCSTKRQNPSLFPSLGTTWAYFFKSSSSRFLCSAAKPSPESSYPHDSALRGSGGSKGAMLLVVGS